MDGPAILVRSLDTVRRFGARGYEGQYHSRSDQHSKTICWSIVFDLLQTSAVLREHVESGRIVFGVNHEMRDFRAQRKKNLDLVIATPGTPSDSPRQHRTLTELAGYFGIVLAAAETERLADVPEIVEGPVGTVLMALEAKACMTAHIKALPRLFDELNSSQLTVHGASDQAIAAGLALVNIADTFMSSDKNPLGLNQPQPDITIHRQPGDAIRTVEKLKELPRRLRTGEEGFDALGILVVDCRNDGSPVSLVEAPPAPASSDDYYYDQMIRRAASQYAGRFPRL